jgi:hypothetical protein
VRFPVRTALPADMVVLRDVFRRSSLSNDGDRMNLLANPDALEVSDIAVCAGRTRVAVTANHHALAFYEMVGFVFDSQAETRFGPASRMHLDVMP